MKRREGRVGPQWDGLPFSVAAFDPGGTTGVAIARWQPDDPDEQLTSLKQIGFFRYHLGPALHHLDLWLLLCSSDFTDVVWESFEFRQHITKDYAKTGVELISREYIGVLKLFCELHQVRSHSRNVSSAKRFIDDAKIKQLGLWLPGMPHAMDATRHLLRYLVVVKRMRSPFTDIWLAA
jgi:hypothetical protein